MKLEVLLPAVVAALAAVGGVVYGGRLTERRERRNWLRDQRLTAYAELANATERCWGAFQLVNAGLNLRNYEFPSRQSAHDKQLFDSIKEWAIWVRKVEDCLPRARLVASEKMQVELFRVDMVVCSVQRDGFMHMNYLNEIKKSRWEFVNSLTIDSQLFLRRALRVDLHTFDEPPSPLRRARRAMRQSRLRLS